MTPRAPSPLPVGASSIAAVSTASGSRRIVALPPRPIQSAVATISHPAASSSSPCRAVTHVSVPFGRPLPLPPADGSVVFFHESGPECDNNQCPSLFAAAGMSYKLTENGACVHCGHVQRGHMESGDDLARPTISMAKERQIEEENACRRVADTSMEVSNIETVAAQCASYARMSTIANLRAARQKIVNQCKLEAQAALGPSPLMAMKDIKEEVKSVKERIKKLTDQDGVNQCDSDIVNTLHGIPLTAAQTLERHGEYVARMHAQLEEDLYELKASAKRVKMYNADVNRLMKEGLNGKMATVDVLHADHPEVHMKAELDVAQIKLAEDRARGSLITKKMEIEITERVTDLFAYYYRQLENGADYAQHPAKQEWLKKAVEYTIQYRHFLKHQSQQMRDVELWGSQAIILASYTTSTPLTWGIVKNLLYDYIQIKRCRDLAAKTMSGQVASITPIARNAKTFSPHATAKQLGEFSEVCDKSIDWCSLMERFAMSYMRQLKLPIGCEIEAQVELCKKQYKDGSRKSKKGVQLKNMAAAVAAASCVRIVSEKKILSLDEAEISAKHCIRLIGKPKHLKKRKRGSTTPEGVECMRIAAHRFAQIAGVNETDVVDCMTVLDKAQMGKNYQY